MRISNLSNKSGNPSSSDYLVLDDGTTVTKIDYNKLAKAIIENYAGSTIAGSAQSVKAALDSLNSKISGIVSAAGGSTVTGLSVTQYGKVVVISGYVSGASLSANTSSHIATISGISLPSSAIRTLCGVAANAYKHPDDVAYCAISTEGKIMVTSTESGSRAVYLTVSYIV